MRLYQLFLFLLLSQFSTGQIIWTEPVFPKANEKVTVFFDATEGTAGLADCNCDVYLHTGLITDESNSPSDWKYVITTWGIANDDWKMTPVKDMPNIYSYDISPTINDYYNVPSNEVVEKLAFVFRNADGSLQGKGVGGTDIFYDVFASNNKFTAHFLSPAPSSLLVNIGDFIDINAVASEEANLSLKDDGILISSIKGTSITHKIEVNQQGTHKVIFEADNNKEIKKDSFIYTVALPKIVKDLPAGIKPGINYLSDSTVVLSLYAPYKKQIFLLGDFTNWEINTNYQLFNTPDGNIWWIEINGLNPGKEYGFQYLIDGKLRLADPYSKKVLDPWNDGFISSSIYPALKAYPAGKTIGVVSVLQTAQEEYNWEDDHFRPTEKSKLVIYELLMRDFLSSHSYTDLHDTLDYLEHLGINAIELMPVNEFEGNESWGYNPSFHGALDKYYGTPDAFKDFINEAHKRGIAVILDVVYNHAFSQSPLAQLYWDDANFKPTLDNPWLNPEAKHPYNVGYDFNHESKVTKQYVKQTLTTWMNDYHIDGFRFDLSKGFTQKQSNDDNQFSAYDASRVKILKEYADFVWGIDSDNYVILEHFATNTEEKELVEYGMMIWGNMNHEYSEASMGYRSNLSGISYKQRGWSVPHLIGYMESHDEERQMYKNINWGNSSGNYNVKDVNTALSRVELTSTFFLTIPGPKMIWQFGELGYDFSINRCTDGSINPNCRLSAKPIRWDYTQNPNRKKVFDVMSKLITLKKNEAVFNTSDFDIALTTELKKIHLNGIENNVTILGNFGVTNGIIDPDFQKIGWWYEFFSGDSIFVDNVNAPISLNPGEYRLYSNHKLSTSVQSPKFSNTEIALYPNPSNGEIKVSLNIQNTDILKIELLNISGEIIQNLYEGRYKTSEELGFDINQKDGIYFLRFITKNKSFSTKLVLLN